MRLRRPSQAESIVAALCAVWVASFAAADADWWTLPIAAVIAALTLILPQRPVFAGAALAALQIAFALAHLTAGNAAMVAPTILAVYSLGRYARLWQGLCVTLAFPLAAVIETADASTLVFAVLLTASVFAFGQVVQVRAAAASRARMAAAALQATDANAVAARIVADERARLGGQSLGVLRDSVLAMKADAIAAWIDLDPGRIDDIAARGRRAVGELRRLLGLFRSPPPAAAPQPVLTGRRWLGDALLGAALIGLGILEIALGDWIAPEPMAWAVAVALPLCVAARRRSVTLACGAAGIVVAAALLSGLPPIATSLVCAAFLAWSAGVTSRVAAWTLLALLTVVTCAWVAAADMGNVPLAVALLALPAFAGHEWSAQDRAGRSASARADDLRAGISAHVESARQEERLRIARELHDVTSHAVGVMVLQASAAQFLRERDPPAAREALVIVRTTAEQAVTELEMMFELLESGAIGSPGLARAAHESVAVMVERLRGAGLEITLELPPVPAALDDTLYRIVQESLTNVVRHSDARRVDITVTPEGDTLSVLIVDDGHRVADRMGADGGGTRFGLTGLSERVRAAGGTLRAGPFEGGFAVEATLPSQPRVEP